MGLQSKMSEWVSGFEEKEGVMRNAMTTRAPCGANNIISNSPSQMGSGALHCNCVRIYLKKIKSRTDEFLTNITFSQIPAPQMGSGALHRGKARHVCRRGSFCVVRLWSRFLPWLVSGKLRIRGWPIWSYHPLGTWKLGSIKPSLFLTPCGRSMDWVDKTSLGMTDGLNMNTCHPGHTLQPGVKGQVFWYCEPLFCPKYLQYCDLWRESYSDF